MKYLNKDRIFYLLKVVVFSYLKENDESQIIEIIDS